MLFNFDLPAKKENEIFDQFCFLTRFYLTNKTHLCSLQLFGPCLMLNRQSYGLCLLIFRQFYFISSLVTPIQNLTFFESVNDNPNKP
jgi:hypothetical protein